MKATMEYILQELKTINAKVEYLLNKVNPICPPIDEATTTKEERKKIAQKRREQLAYLDGEINQLKKMYEIAEVEKVKQEKFKSMFDDLVKQLEDIDKSIVINRYGWIKDNQKGVV